jgi:hypothetical protein
MVFKSLDLRFVYKAAAMILSIKSPDAMALDRSATIRVQLTACRHAPIAYLRLLAIPAGVPPRVKLL